MISSGPQFRALGNFPNVWVSFDTFEKFLRYPGIWGISQIPILIKNVNAVVTSEMACV